MGNNRLSHSFSTDDLDNAPNTLILAGVQGSGKGTQAKRLIQYGGYQHIEMGAMLRDNQTRVVNNKGTMETIAAIQARGDLAPTPDVMMMAEEVINASARDGVERVMFDGLPRAEDQALALNDKLANLGRLDDTRMVHIKISDETARKSIAFRAAIEGRADDAKPATVERRIGGFHQKTGPVINLYDALGKVLEVNGETGVNLERPTVVAARLRELRAIPYAELNGEASELQDLEGEWSDRIQPMLDTSIDEVYFRILQAIQHDRRTSNGGTIADAPRYATKKSQNGVLLGQQ